MADDGSVAPKERINIKYSTQVGDALEEKELPLRMLMVGDYTLRPDDTPLEERKAVRIDKSNFDSVMASQGLSLQASVPNRLSDDEAAGDVNVDLKFNSMKDFNPESVARAVPEMRKLLEMREALVALKGPLSSVPGFRRKLQESVRDPAARERLLSEIGLSPESSEDKS